MSENNWTAFPKAEIHLHLEGAVPVWAAREKANKYGVDIESLTEGERYKWLDFNDFLTVYERITELFRTPEDFGDLASAVLLESAKRNVVYTEIFIAPKLMGNHDVGFYRESLAAIDSAAAAAKSEYGIIAKWISTAVRHYGPQEAKQTAHVTLENMSPNVIGFGMGGAEDFMRPSDFAEAFSMAKEAGLGLTCHAGEWCEAAAIRETVDSLHVTRLGHGVRASKSQELITYLANKKVHLEISPLSNVVLNVYSDLSQHPIDDLSKQLSISVSTDDPTFFGIDLDGDYAALSEQFGWDEKKFAKINRDTMDAAFCEDALKAELKANWSEN